MPDASRTRAFSDPSWGPVGSLLEIKDPELYKQMKALDESMVALERARKAADAQPDASRTRDCLRCGVTFEPARANHRFCTEKCRKDAFRTRKPAA